MRKDNKSTPFIPEANTLVMEDQSLAPGFIQLPKQILWAKNLTRDAKLLYAVLLGYAWEQSSCFPGYARLCADLGASENMVRKYMRELESVGLLSQRRRGLGKTNIYILHDLRTSKIEVQEPHKPRTSKIEVQEPAISAAPEPAQSAVKIETVEQETDVNTSKIRKASRQKNSGRDESARHGAERPSSAGGEIAVPLPADSTPRRGGLESISDTLKRRDPDTLVVHNPAEREVVLAYLTDFARELGDEAPLKSSVTRALNLKAAAGVNLETFLGVLYQARAVTKEKTGSITKARSNGSGTGFNPKNKMPYYFAVIEQLLGLKEAEPPDPLPDTAPSDPRSYRSWGKRPS